MIFSVDWQDDGTDVYTLFMVISSPQKHRERDALRSSLKALLNTHNDVWRKDGDSRNNTLLFFTGLSSDPQLQVGGNRYYILILIDSMLR